MTGRHDSNRSRRSQSATVHRRRRVLGWGSSAGAIVAFGIGPLAATPAAHADGLDVIFDPIINSIDHAVTGLDALSGLDLGANLDLGGLGGGALDQWLTLPTDSVAGVGAVTDAASGVSAATDAAAGAGAGSSAEVVTSSSTDSAATLNELFSAVSTYRGAELDQQPVGRIRRQLNQQRLR